MEYGVGSRKQDVSITLSSRYRITIPRALREQLNLRPGRSTRYVVIVQNSAKGGKVRSISLLFLLFFPNPSGQQEGQWRSPWCR